VQSPDVKYYMTSIDTGMKYSGPLIRGRLLAPVAESLQWQTVPHPQARASPTVYDRPSSIGYFGGSTVPIFNGNVEVYF
jgi:hypothetical protein